VTEDKTRNSGRWPLVVAGVGVAACCGGPLAASWLTSMGVAAAVGGWWSQGHGWVMGVVVTVGMATAIMAGTMVRRARQRPSTPARGRRSREVG
jgi:hypothetical protein